MIGDTLLPEVVRRRGLLHRTAVARLVDAHLAGRGDHSRKLFTLVVLELWLSARERGAIPAPAVSAPVTARA